MSAHTVIVRLTPSQARAVNAALAYVGSGSHEDWSATLAEHQSAKRARANVHEAMAAAGVEP